MAWAILDTSVYIDHWEQGLHAETLSAVRRAFIVRHSSVVLAELRRGAHTQKAQQLVRSLRRLARVHWEPTAKDWWEAGQVIRKIGNARTWDRHKRQEFQNDALIALTARRHGATVVTTNREDFHALARELRISVLPV